MRYPVRAKPKYERQAEIGRLLFFASYDAGERQVFSLSEIAHKLGMKPCQHLRNMIREMADNGTVVIEEQDYPGVCGKRLLYYAGENSELKRMFKRTITIRKHGRKAEEIVIADKIAITDIDGLHICQNCGDKYTMGELCEDCRRQKWIDENG